MQQERANLELNGDEKLVKYTIKGTGLNNITGIAISQETGTGRAPDVVTIRSAPQSGIEPSSGEREIAKGILRHLTSWGHYLERTLQIL